MNPPCIDCAVDLFRLTLCGQLGGIGTELPHPPGSVRGPHSMPKVAERDLARYEQHGGALPDGEEQRLEGLAVRL